VPSSSLLPADPSVLFTTAGMQQFKEYFLGKKSPYGNRVASCQKCFRTSDIDEVGDKSHLTFLEMLGNFSFGSYFKQEAIDRASEFLTENCGLDKKNLWLTVFQGDQEVPEDKESREIWKKLGFPEEKIIVFSRKDNFWGPTGDEGPCGPTTEIHYDLTQKPCSLAKKCLPNCKCGRFVELWNLVFNEYYQDKNKELSSLKKKGVDTGMGLGRLAMVVQKKSSVFETDLFPKIFSGQSRQEKIILDHVRSAIFLTSEGILPSNVEQGYILRRLLRRAIHYANVLKLPKNFLISSAQKTIEIYQEVYPEIKARQADILTVIQNEEEKFEKTLAIGIKGTISIVVDPQFNGFKAYNWYATSGVPFDIIKEIAEEKGIKLAEKFEEDFEAGRKKHQEISRAGAQAKFGGLGKNAGEQAIKLHTATHLLHQALRQVLGPRVKQMGSDINSQRLRFDFSHSAKMTAEEIKKVEEIVNRKIKKDLEVKKEEMPYSEAIKSGALAFFKEKYPENVSVYSINKFSKEICAGPHAKRTSELGRFKIIKEESSGAGVRRLRAVLE